MSDARGPGRAGAWRWRPTLADAWDALLGLASTVLGLGVAVGLVDGVGAVSPLSVVAVAVLVVLGDLLLRAPLRLLAWVAGAAGAFVAGLVVQLVVAWVALRVVPGMVVTSLWGVVLVLVVTAVVMACVRWVLGTNDSEYVVADVLLRARRRARRARRARGAARPIGHDDATVAGPGRARAPGLLVVQLDGVSTPVLRQAIEAGLAPTVQRWIESGSHRLDTWWARVPATTPASQAGLLHGDSSVVPAFRWWDRDLGRLVVTNHPADAALVERRLSTGDGLLAGGGTAVATMFSGDAATTLLVMSRSRTRGPDGARAGLGPGPSFLRFFASPFVLTRAVSLSVGEMVKELYQARRQQVRGVWPRVSRGGWYVVLRGVTNVLMRDLTTSLVAEALVRGDPTVFVDLVDYDEIAHHAGPTRPESMRSLEGLDRVLHTFERVAQVAPRDYRIVALSDHGQALGPTFEQVEGRSLLDTVRALMAEPEASGVQSDTGEDWGPVNALLRQTLGAERVLGPESPRAHGRAVRGDDRRDGPRGPDRLRAGRSATTAERRTVHSAEHHAGRRAGAMEEHVRAGERAPAGEPTRADEPAAAREPAGRRSAPASASAPAGVPEVVVAGSGNLGLVWFPREPRRLTLEDVQERWPGLVPGLAARPGIGVVVVDTRRRGLVAVGPRGVVLLDRSEADVEGEDPLVGYGPRARADLVRAARLEHTGDLLVVSAVDPHGHVHAFEGQVGSHGGLGGEQNLAFLLHPADWPVDDDLRTSTGDGSLLVGAEVVHAQLVRWARSVGLRP